MNKIDLLQNLVRLYGGKASDEDIKTYLDVYSQLLNGDIDYAKLYKLVCDKWEYSTLMPTPKFMKEQVSESIIMNHKQKEKIYRYDCIMLENSEIFGIKKNQIRTANRDQLIILRNNGVKLKVKNSYPI